MKIFIFLVHTWTTFFGKMALPQKGVWKMYCCVLYDIAFSGILISCAPSLRGSDQVVPTTLKYTTHHDQRKNPIFFPLLQTHTLGANFMIIWVKLLEQSRMSILYCKQFFHCQEVFATKQRGENGKNSEISTCRGVTWLISAKFLEFFHCCLATPLTFWHHFQQGYVSLSHKTKHCYRHLAKYLLPSENSQAGLLHLQTFLYAI